jgi:hypothetical protein
VAFSEKNSQNSSDRFLGWHLVKKIHNRTPELAFGEKKLTTLDRKNQQLPGAIKKKAPLSHRQVPCALKKKPQSYLWDFSSFDRSTAN